ncbi:MAG TPA: TlpA disulfide reductase family protein [Stellaceae bacterium]|nr:TlpA disulfide reductase family protein [Stellaceae bacterium]
MTGCRIIVAILILVASTVGAAAQLSSDPDIKIGEFIPVATPQPAPEMSFDGLDGKPVSLADFKGKLVVLNLWATWCQPCLKEMPSLEKLEARLGPGLVVLAVSEDRGGAEVVKPFLAKFDLDKLTIGLDPKSTAIHALRARGLPTSLVVDPDGKVLGKVEGGAEWDSDQMVAVLTKLMPPVSPGR